MVVDSVEVVEMVEDQVVRNVAGIVVHCFGRAAIDWLAVQLGRTHFAFEVGFGVLFVAAVDRSLMQRMV